MKARVQKILRARDKVFQQMRAASQKAYREAHYMEQAMVLGLRSMQKEPEQHAAAIEVVERELAMIRELDRAYIEEAMVRDRKLYPAGFKAWLSFGEALDKVQSELCEKCSKKVAAAFDVVVRAAEADAEKF
jgi:replicative superfamily II helicase